MQQAFGHPKGRFRLLDGSNLRDAVFAADVALVCCLLFAVSCLLSLVCCLLLAMRCITFVRNGKYRMERTEPLILKIMSLIQPINLLSRQMLLLQLSEKNWLSMCISDDLSEKKNENGLSITVQCSSCQQFLVTFFVFNFIFYFYIYVLAICAF